MVLGIGDRVVPTDGWGSNSVSIVFGFIKEVRDDSGIVEYLITSGGSLYVVYEYEVELACGVHGGVGCVKPTSCSSFGCNNVMGKKL